jgi:hypothetical protein
MNDFGPLNVEIPGSSSSEVIREAIQNEYRYSRLGLVLGLICILAGVALFVNGVAGTTNWTVEVMGLSWKLNDAAPGAVLAAVGVLIIWLTKHTVSVAKPG